MKILKKIKAVFILLEFIVSVTVVIFLMKFFNDKNWILRRAWAKMQAYLIGYKLTIKGKPNLEAKMVLMNHQSLLDIVVMENIYPQNIAWVAKKEIAQMKFFGQILTLPKMIILDREDRKSLVKLFRDAKDVLNDNRPIGIFPEGTRGDGRELLEFKSGAKLLAEKLGLKVQPVVIVNTRDVLDSVNFEARSGDVVVRYLDLVDPKLDKDWYSKLHKKMQETLVQELQLLKNY